MADDGTSSVVGRAPQGVSSVPGSARHSAAGSAAGLAATAPKEPEQQLALDPFSCLPKRNQKYASECIEAYLADRDAEELSDNFQRFPNLEVVWFNQNRLTRLENLETNFRIREVYVQDNSLVSLMGLKSCKFLRVLLASNNQIRNLEKQLAFLSRFHFLKKLELFGNPIADEPECRLRLIYHLPQVELLDCAAVKGPERIKAAKVVPNLDKVTSPPRKGRTKNHLSQIERDVFRETRQIREADRRKGEEPVQMFTSSADSTTVVRPRQHARNAQAWSTPREMVLREQPRQTAWEVSEMLLHIQKVAGKQELTRADVCSLCDTLSCEGMEDLGRSLTQPDVFSSLVPKKQRRTTEDEEGLPPSGDAPPVAGIAKHPLGKLLDPESTLPIKDIAKYLVTLDWHRQDGPTLSRRIDKLYEDAKRADLSGDKKGQSQCQMLALRLEGAQDRSRDCQMGEKDGLLLGSARKPRSDFFKQSMLRPHRLMDELTGRSTFRVSAQERHTGLGG